MEQILEFAGNHLILVTAFIVVLGLLISTEFSRLTRGFNDLSPGEVTRLLNDESTLLLDVRTVGEYRTGHILRARHVPLAELESRVGEFKKHRDHSVVVYCRSGNRAASAGRILKKNGFASVYNLDGGMMAWENSQMPVTKAK